jgi:hypothetical protein
MAKKKKDDSGYVGKSWREGELIEKFQLSRLATVTDQTALMQEWLEVQPPVFKPHEQQNFEDIFEDAEQDIKSWSEEDLKMKFIAPVLRLGQFRDDKQRKVLGFFDRTISAIVEGIPMTVRSDFMLAKGTYDVFRTPYFHFQEYKPHKNPTGDSMAQLIEAFLISQVNNNNGKPMYGVEIIGANWTFVIMEGKNYCVSRDYVATHKSDLLSVISILRKFRTILIEKLMN